MYNGSAQKVLPRSACGNLLDATLRFSNGEDERVVGSEEAWAVICGIVGAEGVAAALNGVEELIVQIHLSNFIQKWAQTITSLRTSDSASWKAASRHLILFHGRTAASEINLAKTQEALHSRGTTG